MTVLASVAAGGRRAVVRSSARSLVAGACICYPGWVTCRPNSPAERVNASSNPMAKKCFLSFHYKPDSWRVSQVRQIGAIEEQPLLDANDWEALKKKGDAAIEKWIADNMKDKKCLVVLVGEKTAGRRWVKHEIKKAWKDGMGVLAVHIHNLKNSDGEQTNKGSDPFAGLSVDGIEVSGKVYDPPFVTSTYVYDHIKENISTWVDNAIKARG